MTSHVSVVIPTYNGARFIREALESVFAQTLRTREIIVVDDASTDDTCEIIQKECAQVTLIRRLSNGGFGAACNEGIQRALENGAEAVLLLNQDAIIERNVIEVLLEQLYSDSTFSIVSAFQLTYDGSSIDPQFRHYLPDAFWDDLFLNQALQPCYRTVFVPAATVLIRTEALLSVGGFDPLFHMYGEDNDLCWRLKKAGWRIAILPEARVRHWHGVLNAERSFSWKVNSAFSRAVLHLKQSPRSLPLAYLTLLRSTMLTNERAAGICAVGQCLLKCAQIARSRRGPVVEFISGRASEGHEQDAAHPNGEMLGCSRQ